LPGCHRDRCGNLNGAIEIVALPCGAARLKSSLKDQTRFAMSREGWREGVGSAAQSAGGPRAWTMIGPDLVISDGLVLTGGDVTIQAFETPGHTMGTVSFA
jgi:metallo-beta-lactamase class B